MNKFGTILSHTYMTRVKSKSFLISTIITLLLIFGIANIQSIIEAFSSDDKQTVAVIDSSGELFEPLKENVESTSQDLALVSVDQSEDSVKKAVQDGEYEALVVLNVNEEQIPEATFYADTIKEFGVQFEIEQQLQQLKVVMATNLAGIDQSTVEDIYEPVVFDTVALDESAKTGEE